MLSRKAAAASQIALVVLFIGLSLPVTETRAESQERAQRHVKLPRATPELDALRLEQQLRMRNSGLRSDTAGLLLALREAATRSALPPPATGALGLAELFPDSNDQTTALVEIDARAGAPKLLCEDTMHVDLKTCRGDYVTCVQRAFVATAKKPTMRSIRRSMLDPKTIEEQIEYEERVGKDGSILTPGERRIQFAKDMKARRQFAGLKLGAEIPPPKMPVPKRSIRAVKEAAARLASDKGITIDQQRTIMKDLDKIMQKGTAASPPLAKGRRPPALQGTREMHHVEKDFQKVGAQLGNEGRAELARVVDHVTTQILSGNHPDGDSVESLSSASGKGTSPAVEAPAEKPSRPAQQVDPEDNAHRESRGTDAPGIEEKTKEAGAAADSAVKAATATMDEAARASNSPGENTPPRFAQTRDTVSQMAVRANQQLASMATPLEPTPEMKALQLKLQSQMQEKLAAERGAAAKALGHEQTAYANAVATLQNAMSGHATEFSDPAMQAEGQSLVDSLRHNGEVDLPSMP